MAKWRLVIQSFLEHIVFGLIYYKKWRYNSRRKRRICYCPMVRRILC